MFSSSSPSLFPQQNQQQHQLHQLQQHQQNSGFSVYNILNSAAAAAAAANSTIEQQHQQQAVYLNGTQIDWQPHSNTKLYNSYKHTDTDSQPYQSITPEQIAYNDFYMKSKRYFFFIKLNECLCVCLCLNYFKSIFIW